MEKIAEKACEHRKDVEEKKIQLSNGGWIYKKKRRRNLLVNQ